MAAVSAASLARRADSIALRLVQSPMRCLGMPGRICNAEQALLFYFFLDDFMTPSAMHSHLPLRSIQVSTQT